MCSHSTNLRDPYEYQVLISYELPFRLLCGIRYWSLYNVRWACEIACHVWDASASVAVTYEKKKTCCRCSAAIVRWRMRAGHIERPLLLQCAWYVRNKNLFFVSLHVCAYADYTPWLTCCSLHGVVCQIRYYFPCHPTTCSMIFNTDRSQLSRKKKTSETEGNPSTNSFWMWLTGTSDGHGHGDT